VSRTQLTEMCKHSKAIQACCYMTRVCKTRAGTCTCSSNTAYRTVRMQQSRTRTLLHDTRVQHKRRRTRVSKTADRMVQRHHSRICVLLHDARVQDKRRHAPRGSDTGYTMARMHKSMTRAMLQDIVVHNTRMHRHAWLNHGVQKCAKAPKQGTRAAT
jgi:hypothetical protein